MHALVAGPPLFVSVSAGFPGNATGNAALGVAPFAPFAPFPALNTQPTNSIAPLDPLTSPAMLEPPAVVALPDANVTFSISTAAVTPLITSAGALPAGATFTVCVAGAYAHVPPTQLNPPYTVADDALEPTVTGLVYVPLQT